MTTRSWLRRVVSNFRRMDNRGYAQYFPRFDDTHFFSELSKASSMSGVLDIENWIGKSQSERSSDISRKVVNYYCSLFFPRFFVGQKDLLFLVKHITNCRPTWVKRRIDLVQEETRTGYKCYDRIAPPLRAGFPWEGGILEGACDPLYSVRPHRFDYAPRIALAIVYGAEAAQLLLELLEDWMEFAANVNSKLPYYSNLVVIQRVLALSWAWAFLSLRSFEGSDKDVQLEFTILKVIRADIEFLKPRLGKSYGNNHLLADMFFGWYAGIVFPEFWAAENASIKYEPMWLREFSRQIYEDGTSFEHSIHYHEWACEMASAYVLLSRRNGYNCVPWVMQRTERALRFQVDLCGPEVCSIAIGDVVEDALFPLDTCGGCGAAGLRELYRSIFDDGLLPTDQEDPAIERAFWLTGGNLSQTNRLNQRESFRAYPNGGYFVFCNHNESTRLVFRTGPAPDQDMCSGHMHSDFMSVYLSVLGTPVIVDAGTYTYRFNANVFPNWRSHFMGSQAHNSLTVVDGDPLSRLEGDFRKQGLTTRIRTIYRSDPHLLSFVQGQVQSENIYNGYARGVIHVTQKYYLLYDRVTGSISAENKYFSFQLAPGVNTTFQSDRVLQIDVDGRELNLFASEGLEKPNIVQGDLELPGGWVSDSYGKMTPAAQLRYQSTGSNQLTAILLGMFDHTNPISRIEISNKVSQNGALAYKIVGEKFLDYLILQPNCTKTPIEAWGIRFDGLLLWLRTIDGYPLELRWLAGRFATSKKFNVKTTLATGIDALNILSTTKGYKIRQGRTQGLRVRWPAIGGGRSSKL